MSGVRREFKTGQPGEARKHYKTHGIQRVSNPLFLWKTHWDSVHEKPQAYVTHPDERVAMEAVSSPIELWDNSLPAYAAWLEKNGFIRASGMGFDKWHMDAATSPWQDYAQMGATLWEGACTRAAKDAAEEGVAMTPLAAELINQAIRFRQKLKNTDHQILKEPLPLGPGLESLLAEFDNWVEITASAQDLEMIARAGTYPAKNTIWTRVLAKTPLVATTDGIIGLSKVFNHHNILGVLQNPHLTTEGTDALVTWAIPSLEMADDDDVPSRPGEVFIALRKMGWHASVSQVTLAKVIAGTKVSPTHLSFLADLTKEPLYREKLAASTSRERMLQGFLVSTQGQDWVDTVRDAMTRLSGTKEWRPVLVKWIGAADAWNLEGVGREDLVEYMALPDPGLRNTFMRLMQVLHTSAEPRRGRGRSI